MNSIYNIEPRNVFKYFADICSIPHGSGNTDKISRYCEDFAKARGLWCKRDEFNNVIIKKDAACGYESAQSVILQGHLDMVCEKDEGSDIDFENDGLDIFTDGEFIGARGTTLGGDDGIAIAYILAVLDSNDIPHPPIEAVFTTDEETGMYGAIGIDTSVLNSHTMINIDSENEGIFTVSCAGGATADITLTLDIKSVTGFIYSLKLSGLTGGHSGVEIHNRRANSNKVMGTLLDKLGKKTQIAIAEFSGGLKTNAIPSLAEACIVSETEISDLILDEFNAIKSVYADTDPNMNLTVKHEGTETVNAANSQNIIDLLMQLPDGVIKMSDTIDNLVETSLNIGIAHITDNVFNVKISVRSSVNASKTELLDTLQKTAASFGAEFAVSGEYPAWEYRESSPIRGTFNTAYSKLFGKTAKTEAIHAGLECGIFAGKIADFDCISIGPDILDIHTPRERLSIPSVQRTWELIKEVLKSIK